MTGNKFFGIFISICRLVFDDEIVNNFGKYKLLILSMFI